MKEQCLVGIEEKLKEQGKEFAEGMERGWQDSGGQIVNEMRRSISTRSSKTTTVFSSRGARVGMLAGALGVLLVVVTNLLPDRQVTHIGENNSVVATESTGSLVLEEKLYQITIADFDDYEEMQSIDLEMSL